jgi:hypothetical protein
MQYQLIDYWTRQPAPEAQRREIQARIDRMLVDAAEADAQGKCVLAGSYRHSVLILKGNLPPVRA